MDFGVCASLAESGSWKAAGWDFLEESAQILLEPATDDSVWSGRERVGQAALPVKAGNSLLPAQMKLVGPAVDEYALQQHMERLLKRARSVGMRLLSLGAAGSRSLPEGSAKPAARAQLVQFGRMAGSLAAPREIVMVLEPLSRGICNFINTVAEAMEVVRAVAHPHFQCMVDSHHLWQESESLDALAAAMPWIRHVHLAGEGLDRAAPAAGNGDYRGLFRTLKAGGYAGRISVEARWPAGVAAAEASRTTLDFLRGEWAAA
jgi:sugar phosphate isomerase/epimerase